MDCYDNYCKRLSSFKWLVSLLALVAQALVVIPLHGFHEKEFRNLNHQKITQLEIQDILLRKFDEIKETVSCSENKNIEAINLIQSLLDELEQKFGVNISLSNLVQITQIQLNGMILDNNARSVVSQVVRGFQMVDSVADQTDGKIFSESIPLDFTLHAKHFKVLGYEFYAPWNWNWFGLNKKSKKSSFGLMKNQLDYPGPMPADNENIPDDLIICGIEAMAATLLFLIPSGYTQAAALILLGDMVFRAGDGLKELSNQNKSRQQFAPNLHPRPSDPRSSF